MSTNATPPTGKLSLTALIVGIAALVMAVIPFANVFAILVGIVALVMGLIALARATAQGRPRGQALAGAILGGVAALLAVILVVVYTVIGVSAIVNGIGSGDDAVVAPTAAPTPTPSTDDTAVLGEVMVGEGDADVQLDLGGEPAVVTFDCPTCEGPVRLEASGSASPLIDADGPWRGTYLLDVDGTTTTELSVTTDGLWSMTVDELSSVTDANGAAAGDGDRVVFFEDAFESAQITFEGEGPFSVTASADGSSAPVVDTTGPFSGTVTMSGPSYVQVTGVGAWTILLIDPSSD